MPQFLVRALILGSLLFPALARAGDAGVTYHGRLLLPTGEPVVSSSVQFKLQIRTPSPSNCLMYEEVQVKDLSASKGVFSITLNEIGAIAPNIEPFTLEEAFRNHGTTVFPAGKCTGTNTVNFGSLVGRTLSVSFNDGSFAGWEALPSQEISFVPMALEASSLNGHQAKDFFRVENAGVPQTLGAWSVASYTRLVNIVGGTADIGGNASGFTGSLAGDVTGTQGATQVQALQGHAVANTLPTSGQVLTWNHANSRWEPATPTVSATGVTSVDVSVPAYMSSTGGAITTSGTIALDFQSQLQNRVFASPVSGSGAPSFRGLQISDILSSGGGAFLTGAGCTAGQALTYNSTNDTISCQSITVTASGTAGGDLTGSYPNPSLANDSVTSAKILDGTIATADLADASVTNIKIAGVSVDKITSGAGLYLTYAPNGAACTAGQILKWQNSRWECASESGVGSESDPTVEAYAKAAPSSDFSTPGDVLTLNTVPIAKGGTGATTASDALNALLPSQGTHAGKVLQTNGTAASWVTPAVTGVTSVDVAVPSFMSSAGGAITTSGTITLDFQSQVQHRVLASPLSGSGVPDFRALQISDILSSGGGAFLTGAGCTAGQALTYNSTNDTISCQSITVTASGTAGGDLTGSYPNPSLADGSVTDSKITGVAVNKITSGAGLYLTYAPNGTACTAGQILKWQNSRWECAADSGLTAETDPNVQAYAKAAPSSDFSTPANVLTLNTVPISKGGTGATNASDAINALVPSQGTHAGKVLQTNGTVVSWATLPTTDLSNYVQKTGDTMSGALTLPNNGLTVGTNQLVVSGGNVGVGTASPTEKLDVSGKVKASEFCIGASCVSSWPSGSTPPAGSTGQIQFNNAGAFGASTDLFWDGTNSRLGVKTSVPRAPLHVVESSSASPTAVGGAIIQNDGTTNNSATLRLVSGSAATSYLYFGHLPLMNQGFVSYDSNAHRMAFGTGQATRAQLDSDGKLALGMGIGNPVTSRLQVHYASMGGSANTSGTSHSHSLGRFGNVVSALDIGADSTSMWMQAAQVDDLSQRRALVLNPTGGSVGIGVSSPTSILDVNGAETMRGMAAPAVSSAGQGRIYFDSTSNKYRVSQNGGAYVDLVGGGGSGDFLANGTVPMTGQFRSLAGTVSAPGLSFNGDLNTGFSAATADTLIASTSGAERLRIDSVGRVGVGGAPSAGYGFQVNLTESWENAHIRQTGSNYVRLDLSHVGSTGGDEGIASGNDTLSLRTQGSDRLTISSTGDVGIGTGTPGQKLHVVGTSGTTLRIVDGNQAAGRVLTSDANGVASWAAPTGGGISALTSDVVASGSGSVVATIANNAVTSAKILDATIVGADMNFTGVNTATSSLVIKDSTGKFNNFACSTTGHVPTWTASGFACQAASVTETDPKVGANTTNMLSKWNGTALVASGVHESSGNVGIGTTSPQQKLDVKGTDQTWIRAVNTASTTSANMGVQAVNYMNGQANGPTFWGVNYRGTEAAPAAVQSGDMLLSLGASGGRDNAWNVNEASFFKVNATENFSATSGGSNMTFFTVPNGTTTPQQRMIIDQSGNVGIGTTTPANKLHVAGGSVSTTGDFILTRDNATPAAFNAARMSTYTYNAAAGAESTGVSFQVKTGGADRWVVDIADYFYTYVPLVSQANWSYFERAGNNNFGPFIYGVKSRGTSTARTAVQSGDDLLTIAGRGNYNASSTNDGAFIYMQATQNYTSTASGAKIVLSTTPNGATAPLDRMTVDQNGNVGIGNASPAYTLDVTGNLRITGTPYRTGGDIAWQVPSDARLKTVTGTLDHGLEDLTKLEMIRFRYKENNPIGADSTREYTGVLAQDVQKVIPEAVKEDESGFLSLNTTPIFWSMVNAIKELYAKFKNQEQQVASQSRQIASVDAKVEQLEQRNQQLEKENAEMKARLDKIEKMLNSK